MYSLSQVARSPTSSAIQLEDNEVGTTFNRGNSRVLASSGSGSDFETNRRYLMFSWWLLHRGWRMLMEEVDGAVREVFGPLNPREEITLDRLSELILEVRRRGARACRGV